MKTLLQSIIVAAGSVGVLCAAETELQKVFPTEKLEIAHKEGAVEWYLFETDREFAFVREKLVEFLGKGWEVVGHDQEKEANLKALAEDQGWGKMRDMVVLKNNARPNITVSLPLYGATGIRGFLRQHPAIRQRQGWITQDHCQSIDWRCCRVRQCLGAAGTGLRLFHRSRSQLPLIVKGATT
ncbi:MAG: hypothetical protein ACI9R3_001535 [Verrucomicrobiales bacterium]|jgi:hypothetical protein